MYKNKTERYQFIESVAQTTITKDISEQEMELDNNQMIVSIWV